MYSPRRNLAVLAFSVALAAPAPTAGGAVKPPEELADSEIARAIETELRFDPSISSHALDVEVSEGIVSLSGSVDNLLAGRRAVARAERIRGVRAVVDRISVEAPERPDAELLRDVELALISDPATDAYELELEVSAGQVILRGKVQSFAERNLAVQVASGVRGVRAVVDEIDVSYPGERDDHEIEAEIEGRLQADTRVDAALIDVAVTGGVVRLSGAVGSAAERSQARADARTAGVKAVHDDDLRVEWWARERMRRQGHGALPSEAEIRDAIEDAFRHDPRVVSFQPVIEVEGGVVTLSGVVGDLGARRAAEQDARNTVGVWRVKNHLRVRPDPQRSDAELEQDVAAALIRDPYVNRFALTTAVRNGRVYLHGSVFAPFQRDRAGYVAAGVKGVVAVSNEVEVRRAWTWRSDWEIREDVREQLFWSPLVEAEGVRVRVSDGIVTLEGAVTTWGERNAAVENAYQGGARRVIDRLDVEYGPPLYPGGFVPPHGPLWPYWVG